MDRRALLVDAFTDEALAGNAAGVVPDATGLSEPQMQAIARELGAADTAFLQPTAGATRRVRYFTPATEVDLCGHATIGAFAFLHDDGAIDAGDHILDTNAGRLDVEVSDDGTIWLTVTQPAVRRADVDTETVAEALGIDPAHIVEDLPLARASTGLPFLIVPVTYLSRLGGADPDMASVESLSAAADVAGVYGFTFDTVAGESTLHGRAWAPAEGIPEDPVTGTASGAVGAYLRWAGAFDSMPPEMVFEQGHFVDRPGAVRVRVGESVQVGGRAVVALDGTITVPEIEEDDIIEA